MIRQKDEVAYAIVISRNKKVPYFSFENYEIFAAYDSMFNKLSNDTNLLKIELQLLTI